jgi:hypothetical protein
MNQKADQKIVDIRDLLYVILKKIGIIFLVSLIFAGVLGGYKFLSTRKVAETNVSSILDASERLSGESDAKFSERQLDVNHANDLVNSIKALNRQIENNREYVSDSVLMQIDSEKEAFTCVNLIVNSNSEQTSGVDMALASTYRQYILSGDYLSPVSEDMGISQGYITELFSVNIDTSSVNVSDVDDNGSMRVVSVKVIGPSIEFTDRIMDIILESVESKCVELNRTLIPHTVTVTAKQSSYNVDYSTRDKQTSITYRFESLQQQITNYDKSLDIVAAKLGVSKTSIYSYFECDPDLFSPVATSPIKSVLKFALIGFVFGLVIVIFIISFIYIFGSKFSTQGKFFNIFNTLYKIGVVKPENRRSKFSSFIDRKTGDDNCMSTENSIKVLSANIKNLTSEFSKLLITGTAEVSKIEKLVKDLDINADVKANFFVDPKGLETISKYDAIVLVEQRNYSDCNLVAEELRLVENSRVKLIGVVII